MRLLNVHTKQLESFDSDEKPKYAILSHRWEEEEVTFDLIHQEAAKQMRGWYKISKSCKQAQRDNLRYVWVDTACIDKSSSAELSEAINSMYRWYQEAEVCYTYLSDVNLRSHQQGDLAEFKNSKWFTRGWTLQELLAPKKLLFFNRVWKSLGTKLDWNVEIQKATGIFEGALQSFTPSKYSIAERMSWAAKRSTSRAEDRAYSLMGIFEVNMPMLYGEGNNAFLRLQEEIIKISNDQSIFAWDREPHPKFSLFARSPTSFQMNGSILRQPQVLGTNNINAVQFSVSNAGVSIVLQLMEWESRNNGVIYLAFLTNCITCTTDGNDVRLIGLFLTPTRYPGQYWKTECCGDICIAVNNTLVEALASRCEFRKVMIARAELWADKVPKHGSQLSGWYSPGQDGLVFKVYGNDGVRVATYYGKPANEIVSWQNQTPAPAQYGIKFITFAMKGKKRIGCMLFGFDKNMEPLSLVDSRFTTQTSETNLARGNRISTLLWAIGDLIHEGESSEIMRVIEHIRNDANLKSWYERHSVVIHTGSNGRRRNDNTPKNLSGIMGNSAASRELSVEFAFTWPRVTIEAKNQPSPTCSLNVTFKKIDSFWSVNLESLSEHTSVCYVLTKLQK